MPSLRLTESCEMYKRSLEELFDDENRFVDFLRYSGRFYKLPFSHVATLYRYNPDAEMWADYETWKRYGNNVLRNQRSSAVHIGGNQLKHYFEIGQTTHTTNPYQWSINKAVLQDFLSEVNLSENKTYRSLASYINRHVEQWTSDHAEDILKSFNIPSDGKAQFLKSFCTLAETVVSARCEHNSTYKYKVPDVPDLTAIKTLKSPEDLERICGFVQTAAKTVLLGIERKVTKIINLQRSEQNEQHNREVSQERREAGNDMVRGGTEALSEVRLRREAGDNVSTGHTNVDIQSDNRSDNGHSDEETAGRTDREVRQEVAEVYGGKQSRNDTAPSGQLTLGDYSEGDRQGSRGIVSDTGRSVSQAEPTPDGIYGNGEVGKNEADGNRPRDNDTNSPSVSGIIEQSNIETQTAEISEEVPAVSMSEIDTAIRLINEYCEKEFGSQADFSDMTHVDIAFTTDEETELTIQVYADLENFSIVKEYNGTKVSIDNFASLDEMTFVLGNLEFDTLVALSDEEKAMVKFDDLNTTPIGDDDYFFNRPEAEEYEAIYYNPYADAGGQFVIMHLPYDLIAEANKNTDTVDAFCEYLDEHAKTELVDLGTPEYEAMLDEYAAPHPDFIGRNSDVMDKLVAQAIGKDYVSVNDIPTITCEWSESEYFENGRTYTVREFDEIMKRADTEKVEGRKAALEKYGSWENWYNSGDEEYSRFLGYDKTKFTVNLPDGTSFSERQDIGDGDGGVIDFLRQFDVYNNAVSILEKAAYGDDITQPIVEIYQLNDDENLRDYRFVSLEQLHKDGHNVESKNYKPVYSFNLKNGETLEDIYDKFNISRPDDFKGHSLSMGDIIVIKQNGKTTAHYVDRIGFAEVPEFFLSREQKTAEMSTVTAYRVGDFYEFFGQDAKTVAERLNLALTRRGDTPMTGIPTHVFDFDDYMDKLSEMQINVKVGNIKEVEHLFKPKDDKSATAEENQTKEETEVRFNSVDFEKLIPSNMRFKQVDLVNGNEIYWVTQDIFSPNDLEAFQQAVRNYDGNIKKFYVTSRSLSPSYKFEDDRANRVIVTVTPDEILQDDYLKAIEKAGLGEYLTPGREENRATYSTKPEDDLPRNFHITDDTSLNSWGGEKTRYNKNIEAIKLLHDLENSGRTATYEEQQVLAQYAGWGGVSKAFDPNNTSWEKEYNELKELLTPEEYAAAKSSINNAHFTNPEIIRAMYKALGNMGIKDGNILEPSMGVGNFFGCLPKAMQDCKLYGVELDSITGRIAKQLYPEADIQIKGFEKADFPDNYFSAAIGNVPFGNYGVADKNYDKHNFLIHDYFFAKALDKVAANGIVAFITSKGTLDKQNSKVREYLAQHADLVGAIRLPNNAFKGSANTEVTSDIIFLRKREKAPVEMPDWVYVGENADGIPINQYFVDNPDMILGKMERTSGRFGEDIVCTPIEGADLASQLDRAVSKLKIDTALKIKAVSQDKENGIIPATDDVRNFTYTIIDNKIYFRENGQMTEVPANAKKFDRIKGLIELRETLRDLITIQAQNCTDDELKSAQAQLEKQYDSFVEKFGYINDRQNNAVFSDDDDYNTLCSLEVIDPESKKTEKAAIFSQRTVKPNIIIEHVDTPQEAMQVSLDTKGKIDLPYMADLCSRSVEQLTDELVKDGIIYRSPDTMEYEDYSEYLSGNVRQKLRTAELYAQTYPEFERNVNALKNVIPPTINAGEIHAALGVSWVDVADYEKFMMEYAHANKDSISPLVRTYSGEYKVPHKNTDTSITATSTYGTKRMSSYAIFENLLNKRDLIVRDALLDTDGKTRYVINQKETQFAKEKGRQMQEAFAKWLWQDPERRQKYVDRYNELFNSIVGREFDGSHQTFPGMSPYIELKKHQKDAIARAKYGGNTLFAHAVGAGKSFEMIASVMEKQRLGLINKACVAVPKALVGQMAAEWLRLYPQAKLLVATEKDFTKDNRQKFIARCCTGDYAAVIMSYEQFEKIPMSLEYQKQFIESEINVLTNSIQSLKSSSGIYGYDTATKTSIKDMEIQRKKLQARLIKLIEGGGKTKDTSLSFEQLGFDCMVIDEAHNYKNGLIVTKMQGVSGVQSSPAQKSEDMLMKTTYLNETSGCKNIIFATGTPVSNSMSELYTMQRYLRPDLLAASGIQNFDDWASNFGEVVSQLELKPAGDGYRPKKRFAKFVNLPELMQMYKEFADIKTSDSLNLPVPDIKGGKPQTIVASPNDFQKEYLQILAQRSERIHSGAVDPSEDNMLKITHEARLLGLDARTLNPDAENSPNSKVNLCIEKIMEIYQKTSADKGVQAVFCDIAINNTDGRFSVYDYIKEELIKRGIPKDEICFAGDAKDQKQRNDMQAQLRSGAKRIVLASTSKLGTGANIQTRLAALHHLDIPWKPSDLEQRNGRIVRQGNMFKEVEIYNYVTEDTFDAYMLNIVVNKQKFISQLMSSDKAAARTCEDVDELVLNYAEMQALATGDPRIKEKIELDGEVAKLRTLESEHLNEIYRLQDFVVGGNHKLIVLENQLEMCKQDAAFAQEHTLPEGQFSINLLGKEYAERKDAATVLQKQILACMTSDGEKNIGTYRGFNVSISREAVGYSTAGFCYSYVPYIHLQNGGTKYSAELQAESSDVGIGNITRLENVVKFSIDKKIKDLEKNISDLKTDIQEAERTKDLPFELAEELQQKSERLSQLNAELNLDKIDESIMENEPSADKSFEKDNLKSDKKHGDVRR